MAAKGGTWTKSGGVRKFVPAGGGGAAAGGAAPSNPLEQEPLGAKMADTFDRGERGDVGNLFKPQPADLEPGGAKSDPAMVRAFRSGQENYTPAIVVEQISRGDIVYRPADPRSATILASAKAAGAEPNVIISKPGAGRLAASNTAAQGKPQFGARASGGRDAGNLSTISASDIRVGNAKVTASQSDIDRAARAIRSQGQGRAIVPIPVRRVGRDSYQIVGNNANALAVAQRANVDPWTYIVSD
jgi:hypothetical protein